MTMKNQSSKRFVSPVLKKISLALLYFYIFKIQINV